ncbi:hypothetical protein BH11PLA1_BH11PLA1_15830 [soil metagenome]
MLTRCTVAFALLLAAGSSALAIDEAHRAKGERVATKAIEFLKAHQDPATGGWSVPPPKTAEGRGRPNLPAIAALVLNGMLLHPGASLDDPSVGKGLKYVLSFRQPDGGIYDGQLPSYNTAISLSMLSRVSTPEAEAAIAPAQEFLRHNQWGAPSPVGGTEAPTVVTKEHPHFGGWGYGNRARPDISNTAFAIEALADSGVPKDDPAFQRAIIFLQRLQMDGKINDQTYAKGSAQGGFIYGPGENAQSAGRGNSFAGNLEETMDDGSKVSMLRAYGSSTYLGFKSYIYAGLTPSDPRVQTALRWMQQHYSPFENPAMGSNGFYYYMLAMSRALDATNAPTLAVARFEPLRMALAVDGLPKDVTAAALNAAAQGESGAAPKVVLLLDSPGPTRSALVYMAKEDEVAGAETALKASDLAGKAAGVTFARFPASLGAAAPRDWQNDMIDSLALLQNADGGFKSLDARWMEDNQDLIAAYSLLALEHILRDENATPKVLGNPGAPDKPAPLPLPAKSDTPQSPAKSN